MEFLLRFAECGPKFCFVPLVQFRLGEVEFRGADGGYPWVPAGIVPLSGGTGWGLCQSSMMSRGAAVMLVDTLSLSLSTPIAGIGASIPTVTAAIPAAKSFVFIGSSLRSSVLPIGRIPNYQTIGFNN